MEFFKGAIGLFKNPASHRRVDFTDATAAAEVVLLADLLMRLLDKARRARPSERCGGRPARALTTPRTAQEQPEVVPLAGWDSLTVGQAVIAATGGLPNQIRRSFDLGLRREANASTG
jgi:hypothetical protein